MSQFDKRNISMMMDLYEMTMADCYFAEKDEETQVVFDVFYRKIPTRAALPYLPVWSRLSNTSRTCTLTRTIFPIFIPASVQ